MKDFSYDYIKKEIRRLLDEDKIPKNKITLVKNRLKQLDSDVQKIREINLEFFKNFLENLDNEEKKDFLNIKEAINAIEEFLEKNKKLDDKITMLLKKYIGILLDKDADMDRKKEVYSNFEKIQQNIHNEKLINEVTSLIKNDGSEYAQVVYKNIYILGHSSDAEEKRHASILLKKILDDEYTIINENKKEM